MTLHTLVDQSDTDLLSRPELERRLRKLAKINLALMQRVERSMDQQGNAYSLFQTAIGLETQVRLRTDELKQALCHLEKTNDALVTARDAAELANRLKTRFFTAVGHDLLQPLHAARLTLSAMQRLDGEPETSRLPDQIDHALSTIEELLKTILDLSKLEAGTLTPALQPVPLRELFGSLIVEFGPLTLAKQLGITSRCGELSVRSDPLMLRRILQNLFVNAVHYTERGKVKLLARHRGPLVHIEIWDTGPGIPPAERERIFEEFQRGSASERSRRGGMGLGLSIVQRMAAALDHPIRLHSQVGRGTMFAITVPYAGPAPSSQPIRPAYPDLQQAYGFAGSRIVIVENDAASLEAMRTLLERWSCETRCLSTLTEANSLIRDEPELNPDLLLVDFHLDKSDCGLTAVKRMRDAWGNVPGLVVTADHSTSIAAESHRAGCEVLCKPVKPAELRALMGHLLS